jgi:hypothetical protein
VEKVSLVVKTFLFWLTIAGVLLLSSMGITLFSESKLERKSPEYYGLGPFRGMVCSYRWVQVMRMQRQFRFEEVDQLTERICNLQPYVEESWDYLAWNLAFNLFVEAGDSVEVQWRWLSRGLDHLDEGLFWNPQSYRLTLAKIITLHLRSEGRPEMLKRLDQKYGGSAMTLAAQLVGEMRLADIGDYTEVQWAILVYRRALEFDHAIEACNTAIKRFPSSRERFGEFRAILENEQLESRRK